ncbi:MAG: type II and III secretion system protein [Gammaproteobacteria bacterium]|nr:type II and III secretion system protein [Gammaproteobacteria bacterium]
MNVGSRISINTGTSTGTGGNTVTTNQYIDTGVLLTVTPRINAGGRVTMEINQEVSSANRAVTGNNNPDIDNRKAQTTVNVASGETMVLAGLIREQRDYATAGVPFLSKSLSSAVYWHTNTQHQSHRVSRDDYPNCYYQ